MGSTADRRADQHETARGELDPTTDVDELADATMAAMQGGLLLAQVRRDAAPLRAALAAARAAIIAAHRVPVS